MHKMLAYLEFGNSIETTIYALIDDKTKIWLHMCYEYWDVCALRSLAFFLLIKGCMLYMLMDTCFAGCS